MPKAPFERVFSLVERKKLLRRVAKENIKILIKSSKNEVMEFKVSAIDEAGNLEGQIIGPLPRDFEKITALFYVDNDRYFVTTRVKRKSDFWIILNDANFYKFNRRSAFRIHLPASVELTLYVNTVRNIEIGRKVSVIEFSSTGARIHWYNEKKLSEGTQLKGALQWGNGKILPVEATIMHSPEPGIYGIRFINSTAVTVNRLKMLSVEIQQAVHFHKS